MKTPVSLFCTMRLEEVVAAQRIAEENDLVSAEVCDRNHYPALREKHAVMSVACLVVVDEGTTFGKKNIRRTLDFFHLLASAFGGGRAIRFAVRRLSPASGAGRFSLLFEPLPFPNKSAPAAVKGKEPMRDDMMRNRLGAFSQRRRVGSRGGGRS